MIHIKLFEAFAKDPILDEYITEIKKNNSFVLNPWNSGELILNNEATIEIDRFDKKNRREINLKDISVVDRGQGIGSKTMKILTDAADAIKVDMTLHAKPFGRGGLKKRDLVNMYKKFGFETVAAQYGIDDVGEIEDYVFSEESEGLDMFRKHKA